MYGLADMQKKEKHGALTLDENRAFHLFFENELYSIVPVFAMALVLCAAIYAVSVLRVDAESRLIYVVYRVFLVAAFIAFTSGLKIASVLLAMFFVDRGRFTVFKTRNYRHCVNCFKKDLKGKQYYVLHVLWYRYAFRISSD